MKTFDNVKFKGTFRDYQKRVLDNAEKYLLNKKINIVAAPGIERRAERPARLSHR